VLEVAGVQENRRKASPLFRPADVADELDWDAFSDRYFPGERRRHHLTAISAYGAYRHGGEGWEGYLPRPPRLRLVPKDPDALAIEAESETAVATQRLLVAMAAMQPSDNESGYRPQPGKRLRRTTWPATIETNCGQDARSYRHHFPN